jgi:hypothetical protein
VIIIIIIIIIDTLNLHLNLHYRCSWHWHTCKVIIIIITTTVVIVVIIIIIVMPYLLPAGSHLCFGCIKEASGSLLGLVAQGRVAHHFSVDAAQEHINGGHSHVNVSLQW